MPVTVYPQPIINITGSNSECVGATGIVYDTELGQSNYNWTISGGTITSGSGTNSIVVNWTTAGSRWVAVNYTDANGCDAATATQYPVTVLPLPTPEITGSSSVCVGATNVQYATDSDAGITDYQWTVSGGGAIVGSSTNANLFVNWNTVGPQTVSVTYTGANGCDAAAPTVYNVTVLDLPAPAITGWDDVCNNSTNVYTTEPGMTNYDWVVIGGTINSGGTVTDNTATVTWNTPGNQSISVNYEQTGCPATSPFVYPVFVNPLPIVDAGPQQSIPNGTPTTLTGTASGGTGTLLYQWEPASLIATGENSLTATTENIYVTQLFELEVTDDKLCSSTDQVEIVALGDPLSVIATASPNPICNNGETVQLGAEALGGNSDNQADYTWTSTPAGFTSTAQNPTVNPTFTTTYNVSVWDGFNTATSTILVTVNPLPTVFNVTGGGEYCSGGTGVNIGLNGSQSGVNYQLILNGSDFGSPIPGTGNSITFTNNTGAGTYTVRAINATTNCENDMTGSATISINPLPTADAGDFQLIPYGTSTSLTGVAGSGTSPYNYLWTPAASISGSNTSLTATTTNLYTNTDFTFRVTDNKGCIASDIVSITLDGTGLAVTATAVEDVICNNGETVLLNAEATGGNSANIANYSWTSTPAGFTSNEQSPQVNPTQTTIYHVSVNDGFNTATNSVTVTVNPLPTLFTVTGGGEYCSGGSGLAVGLNGSQTGVSYQLVLNGSDIGSPLSGTGSAISFGTQTSAGNYTVYATHITTSCERDMTGNVSISINPLPIASAGDDIPINYGTSTTLSGSASSGTSPWSYLWTPDNMIATGAGTANPITENLIATTDFLLTVTDSKGCTDTDDMQVVVVGDPLSVIASVDNSVICSGASAQLNAIGSGGNLAYTYSWSSDPGSWTSTEQNPVVNPTTTTNYTVIINDGYNTATSSVSVTVRPLAIVYNVTGGGSYCTGESGVEVGLSNSETGVSYQLYVDGTPAGTAVNGTGSSISFGEQSIVGSYTVKATVITSGCENDMASSVQVDTLPLPETYSMTGGGSYPQGGIGVPVALTNSQIGVDYQLFLDGSPIGTPVAGTGSPLSFGNQTLAGEYTALAVNAITACTNAMAGSVTVIINPYPSVFHVFGGGSICFGSSAEVGLDGSEIGIAYTLLRDGTSVSLDIPGTGDSIQFGAFSTQGIYTVRAENISTGLTIDMDGFAEIIVNSLPNIYSLSYSQPGDNCVPIIPRLGGSQINAIYELNYEDFNGFYSPAIETLNGTGNPLNFSSQINSGTYTVSAYIDYTDVICRIDMSGSLIADSIPKEFQIYPQGELCENDQELCLLGSEAGINYQLWLGNEPVGNIVPGASDGSSICFGTLAAPGTYRIHAINALTGCEIFFTNQVVVNPQPIQYVIAPVDGCAGSDIILEECEAGIEYYLYLEPANKEFIEIQGPLTCSGSGQINFGPQFDEGTYRIKAVNPTTNCWTWMNGTTTIYPNPEVFEMVPQGNACPPIAIYLENFQPDVTYYLYRDDQLVLSDDGSDGSVNFGAQSVPGNYTIGAINNHPNGMSCESTMSGSLQIFETPTVRTLLPAEPQCPPAAFYLNSSEAGISYELWSDIAGLIQTIVSTDGGQINFDPVSNPGQYYARAVNGQNCSIEMNGIRTVSPLPVAYNITPSAGQWCSNDNVEIGLSDSDAGFTYQLHRIPFSSNPVATIPGDGNAITFGTYDIIGNYRVLAIDDATGCEQWMNGEIQINDPPLPFSITANGSVPQAGWNCPPVEIGLQLSETGVNYTLFQPDGTTTLAGTGAALIFGTYSTSGEYYVVATNPTTTCSAQMPGTINIYDGPEIYTLTIVGEDSYCFGDDNAIELVLNSSQPGVIHQLFKDDISNPVMAEITGTGELLSWFPVSQFGEGNYFVMAHFADDPTCSATMNGNIAIDEIALPTASLAGSTTICEINCTTLNFNVTSDLPFELIYSANGVVQPPLNFDPSNPDYSIEICPTDQTIYEIVSVNYTVHPFCEATDISGSFTVFVDSLPVAETGPGGLICETQGYHFGSAFVENASNWSWEIHEGQGSFDNPGWITPVFYPDPVTEITDMVIRLVAYGSGECVGNTDTSFATIQVYPQPQAFAGTNDSACVNSAYPLNEATAENYSTVHWEVISGFGSIDSPNTLNPNYQPHQSDIGTTVTLQLTATGEGPCLNLTATSLINIYIEGMPTADAGASLSTCVLNPIQVTQATASYYSEINWTHNGNGNLTNSNAINPIYFPDITDAGTIVTLTLTASGVGSCDSEVAVSETNIQIDPLPEVFAGTDNFTCELEAFQLDEATATNTSSTIWSIVQGNGTINDPDELNATYTPAASDAGTTVILRLRGFGQGNCSAYSDDSFINIEVITSPEANFEVATPTCVNELVSFEDASTTNTGIIEQWIWNFGDQSPEIIVDFPDDPNVSHTYTGPGNFVVTLTVVNSNGCEASTSQTIQITPAPIAAFVIQGGLCADSPVNFIDLSQEAGGGEITAWDWNFGDGNTSDQQNPVHSYDAPGTYTVTLTAYNESGCASNTFEATITIEEAIQVEIDDSNLFACVDELYQFNATSADAVFWFWDFGDGNTSTEQNPQHAYATSGAYFVTLTGTSMNGCSNTDEVMLIVNPEPIAGFNASQTACTNEAMLFTDTSVTPNGVITEWLWDMGDGTVYTINNPNDRNITHQFVTPNQFLVSLTITDAAGCTDTHTQTVVVQPGPVAMFTYSASCTGQPVLFTDLSIPNGGSDIVSWIWDFGDIPSGNNNTSNLQNPAHTFVGEMPVGGYTVSLIVTNATGCSDTLSQQVLVEDSPLVEIIPSETNICLTESILFSGVADNVVSWFWTFGDGNTSTLQNPTHTYLSAGTYNVNLSVVTAQGCTNDASTQVVVNHIPSAGFTTNSPVCLDSPIQFNNTSVSPNGNIQTWIWDFGDGTTQTIQAPDDPNVAYTYLQAGTFNVTLTVIDNVGCEDDFTRQVNVQNNPLANFTFEQTCFGEPVMFTDLSSPNGGPDLFSWVWEFGDPLSGTNNNSNLQNPSHQFTAPGIFNVSLTVTNTLGCTNTIEIDVEVSETIPIDFSYDAAAFCPGEPIDFTPDGIDIVSYQWDFGDGGTSIQHTPQYIYSNPGTYTVSLIVTAIDGCQGYVEHDILINEEPLAAFSTDSPSCSGAPTQFFNASSSPTGYITEWIWNFGDGSDEVIVTFPDNPDVSHQYAEGTYIASLTVTNSNGCSNTVSQDVIVAPGPIAAFDYVGTCAESPVIFTDLSQENGGGEIVGWQWDFGDPGSGTNNTSILQNPSHIFSSPGSFDVTLIIANFNGCMDTVMNSITVDDAILVEIISDSDSLCLGTPASFTGNAPGAVIWNWDFGDGNTSMQQNPEHTYTQTGNFMVTLTAETPDGCSNGDTLMVVVRPNPVSIFTSTSPVCSADSVQFLDWSSTQNGYLQTWIWDMGDGNVFTIESPDDPNINYLYANPGIFEVVLTVIDNVGCEHSSSQLVQVEASPMADFSYDESCLGVPVLFTDLTSTNGGTDIFGWEWYFGDPNSGINNTSTLQNPSHLFTVADTFNVTLIVINTMGCTDTIVKELIVSELPEVDFTIADDSICMTTPAQFTGIGENINTWFWEFGDGGTSIQQNPSYMYVEPGAYDVTLTVTSIDQCQNSISYPIFVNDVPIADFSMNNGCMGDTTYFTDETVSLNGFIVEWAWDFGDGNTSDIQNPAHYYNAIDDYLVSLTVTDNFGCFETISRWVSIYDKPTAGFSFNQVCDPVGNVFFFDESESSGNGSPLLEYVWNFHDGYFSNEINPNHIFPETDTCYVVSLTVTDAFGCESITTDTICIWEPITVDFTSTEVCFGNATFFEATYLPEDDSIVSYAWNFNDGSDIFLTYRDTTSHIFANSGTFFVELTATNLNGCEFTTYNEVVVNGLPLPDFEYLPGLCENPAQFTDLSDGNGALVESWLWNFGDPDSGSDNTSDLQNPTHLFSDQGGVYEVTLVVTNFNGCVDSITKEVIQDPCVQASFIVPTVTLCAESEICFTENSYIAAENGTINKWIWNFGDNTPDYEYTSPENPVCHAYTDPEGGEFVVSLTIEATVNGNAFIDTYTEVITINPRPTARFIPEAVCQNTEAIFTDNSIGNGTPITNWFWDFGDLTTIHDTSSMQNTSYQYPTHGQYDVQLVVINEYGCSDTLVSEIEIWQPPSADFIAVDSCVTYITYFNDLSIEGDAPIDSWFWHFGDPNSNNEDGNPWTDSTATDRLTEHIYMQSGTYFTSLVVEDENGCRDTVRHSLPVHPIPQASFIYEDRYEGKQGQVFFQNTSDPSASTFFWDFMTGQTSTEENPIYQFEEDGLYEVMLVAYNSHLCPDTAINAYEIIFTGLYFPNSFVPGHSEQEFSEFKGKGENLETYTLEIFTSWGQLIWSSSRLEDGRPADAWDGTYNNQDLPTGSYIWKASATFRDGTIWEGSDNGDGNIKPYGIINLIR
ncbi:MAG: PKD domain-containing protein [Bacteroidales bacterium]|nr:PKD domain-containing protein [Bacteroidales bacterium]